MFLGTWDQQSNTHAPTTPSLARDSDDNRWILIVGDIKDESPSKFALGGCSVEVTKHFVQPRCLMECLAAQQGSNIRQKSSSNHASTLHVHESIGKERKSSKHKLLACVFPHFPNQPNCSQDGFSLAMLLSHEMYQFALLDRHNQEL